MQRTRFSRRVLALICTLLFLLPALPASAGHGLDALTVGIVAADDMVLSPLTIRERDPLNILALVYEGLVTLDDDEIPQPCLAASWDAPQGSSNRWIFHLRPDVTFHNGKPLTAQDVVATLDYIFMLGGYDEEHKTEVPAEERGVWGNLVAYLKSWRALDNQTVEITAKRNYYGVLNAMTFPILPAEAVSQASPPGTGPYRIETYEPGDRIWLTSNPTWWQAPPTVYNIVANIYENTDRALDAFDAMQVDATMTRSLSATRYANSMRSFLLSYRTRQLETLLMQHVNLLADENIRRAIIAAIDRDRLIKLVYQDMATPAQTPIAPGTWLYDSSATSDPYDPAAARAMLDAAGWMMNAEGKRTKTIDGTPTELKLRLMSYEEPGNSVRRNAAAAITEMLNEVGISITSAPMSYDDAKLRLEKGNFDLALAAINLDVVPDPGFLLMAGYANNYCRYKSDIMKKLIESLRTQTDSMAYQEKMREVQHQFVMDAPFMCLYFRNGAMLSRQTFTDARDIRELELLRGIESW